ncbi:MAG: hypothetical protein ABIG67_00360 [Pseudomonadota bacterium]
MKIKFLVTSFIMMIFLSSYDSTHGAGISTLEKASLLNANTGDPISIVTAQVKKSDKVTIQKARWVAKKRNERFLIVHAISDAPGGSVTLIAEIIAEDKTIKKDKMRYEPDKGYYLKIFPSVWSKPGKVKVTSSGGGSETVSVK